MLLREKGGENLLPNYCDRGHTGGQLEEREGGTNKGHTHMQWIPGKQHERKRKGKMEEDIDY